MQIEDRSLEANDSATQHWFAPVAMLVAWLARLFEQIAKLKRIRRTTRFKPNWRDHFESLRQCEWRRDQILAAGAAQLLAGKALDLDALEIYLDPPANYGGPCPRTPFAMNRRFLALARFNAEPEAAVRKHAARIGGCPLRLAAQATSPMLRMEEEGTCARANYRSLSSSGALRRDRWHTLPRDGGGSHRSRGPPLACQFSTNAQPRPNSRALLARTQAHVRNNKTKIIDRVRRANSPARASVNHHPPRKTCRPHSPAPHPD